MYKSIAPKIVKNEAGIKLPSEKILYFLDNNLKMKYPYIFIY